MHVCVQLTYIYRYIHKQFQIQTKWLSDLVIEEIFVIIQEGWSLAECFSVRCVVAAPYVVPYRYLRISFPFCIIKYSGVWIQLCLFCVSLTLLQEHQCSRISPNIWNSDSWVFLNNKTCEFWKLQNALDSYRLAKSSWIIHLFYSELLTRVLE